MSSHGSRHRGFTLIEMMVAMAVLAVGMGAIIKAAGENARNATYLRDREVARWIASDALTQLQVVSPWAGNNSPKGEVEMFNLTWYWQAKIQKVQDPDLRRVDVEVRRNKNEKSYIYSISGFIGNPELKSQENSALPGPGNPALPGAGNPANPALPGSDNPANPALPGSGSPALPSQ